ncbi:MAG: tRNA (adenosine(37)-N6)-threonylcarbamoyltransferase complex dimerization subunit type 1 TsaB [Beijerinckiaceae bacterium]
MNILAFDTCFDACSVAAGKGLRSLSPAIDVLAEPMAVGHAERLLPMIDEVMASVRMRFSELTHIAVTVGPGTFTGARIGVAAARALALAHDIPIVSTTSLHLMAMSPFALATGARTLVIAVDARRGEVYVEQFCPSTLRSRAPAALLPIDAVREALPAGPIVVAGSGAAALTEAAQSAGIDARAVAPSLLPDALDMLFVAPALERNFNLLPLYLRAPDAKPPAPSPIARATA